MGDFLQFYVEENIVSDSFEVLTLTQLSCRFLCVCVVQAAHVSFSSPFPPPPFPQIREEAEKVLRYASETSHGTIIRSEEFVMDDRIFNRVLPLIPNASMPAIFRIAPLQHCLNIVALVAPKLNSYPPTLANLKNQLETNRIYHRYFRFTQLFRLLKRLTADTHGKALAHNYIKVGC